MITNFDKFSYVIAGSGLLGSVLAERIANELNEKVLVIEKRAHIGGNCYSETDSSTNIEYHKYGTHIFHTSNERVWKYINRFTGFNGYRHQVLAQYADQIYQLPVNLETINAFFKVNLKPYEVDSFMAGKIKKTTSAPANFEEKAISLMGEELYNAFIKGYTQKQWQIEPSELPESIFNRLPFRKNYDENYFFDKWQGIPDQGYTTMFKKMLSHPNIHVLLNTDFFSLKSRLKEDACIIYSGPIDRFFDYKHGRLSWRTLNFEKEEIAVDDFQGNSVINFPEINIPYTRIHEPKHLHPERNYSRDKTIVFKEYSRKDDGNNPFYPIPSTENMAMYELYKKEAGQLKNTYISGRLGDYKYYDMHQTIERALDIFEQHLVPKAANP